MKFHIMPGEFYSYKCLGCGKYNGGGIISETHTREQAESDPYCPVNQPCVHCGKGPVVVEMDGVTSTGEEILTNLTYSLVMGVLIAINIGMGLHIAGLEPGAIPNLMSAVFLFCLFLGQLRKEMR